MESRSSPLGTESRLKNIVSRRSFWILTVMLASLGVIHYLTPQVRFLPIASHPLGRHAVERIIFILPVAGATFAFGQAGGLVALALAILIMLPRVLFISPYPTDAFTETVAVGFVGYLVVWMIETQEREKRLRQEAVSRLRMVNAVTALVSGSLELEQILNSALDKVLEVMKVQAGSIYLLNAETQELVLAVYRGMSPECAREAARFKLGESLTGWVGQSGEPIVVGDVLEDPRLGAWLADVEGMRSFMAVPLKSMDKVLGVVSLADPRHHLFTSQDMQLLVPIGHHIGVAIENARLYENLRFYIQRITQTQEDERRRIARELHDETIQLLIVISRRLEVLATIPERLPETAMRHLESLRELIGDALGGVRRFVQDLRPPTLDHLGLVATLEGLTSDLKERDGIDTELRVKGEVRRLGPEEELMLFRVAQEAVNNVRRHSGASQVMVQFEFCPGRLQMIIEDNGRGFNAPERMSDLASTDKLGLVGMHERVRTLGGTLTIQSEVNRGTTVIVDVPV